MSDEYEQYAEFEKRRVNIAAGRRPDSNGENFQEYLKSAPYQYQSEPYTPEQQTTVYTDEQGRKFRFIFGQRVYMTE